MQQFTYGEHPIDEYVSSLSGHEQETIQHVYDLAQKLVPEAEQGVSYGMPCLKCKGKGLISVMVTKKFLSLYPFSAIQAVIGADELVGFETTSGSVHFSPDHPIPDDTLRKLILARRDNIRG